MNWLDLALIITVIGGTFFGLWIGFVRAAFTTLGVIIGIMVAGLVTDNLVVRFAEYLPDETLVNILGYAISILVSGTLALIVGVIVRKCLRMVLPRLDRPSSGDGVGIRYRSSHRSSVNRWYGWPGLQ